MKPYRTLLLAPMLAVTFLPIAVHAQQTDRIPVLEVKPLLKLAIERGSARGVIVGQASAYVRQKFDAAAPIEIDVRVLHVLADPGCSRLEVTTRQKDVLEKGKRGNKELTYQVSYCRDGRFPDKK